MRFLHTITPALALLTAGVANAASLWGFDDATVSLVSRTKEAQLKEPFGVEAPLDKLVRLGPKDTIKVVLTAKEGKTAKRPHQAFLVVKETESGLEAPFPLKLKENGKGVVEIAQKDLPVQLFLADAPLSASVVIGSFGSAAPVDAHVFDIDVDRDPNDLTAKTYKPPLRYGKLPIQGYKFNDPPKSPQKVMSLFFTLAVLATAPALIYGWHMFGANLNHAPKAFSAAPISHAVFFGSIVAMEGVFFTYYAGWKLLTVLPMIAAVAVVAFVSGSKALGEVQSRRLAGER
ncbi:hypothetical protein SODALDRAFT_321063 [Sodiomyces alkalinus F11]|uniref:Ribophorin II C-terminal domain-containing protein n=1 Tax=Sodiomyces alkalinus (strain CBS 110278 / VKM F-3762 / F11) TaxID=1314773 RepID=A0A3N2PKN5_SODAK|nr:hypothetical protein SODALDRAFT_321063 [Sodiomyces alkalinus F11]ROT34974.1 hypothetical protein SODALDRAFT_321063 [Sodiomyces alkalinus F11]